MLKVINSIESLIECIENDNSLGYFFYKSELDRLLLKDKHTQNKKESLIKDGYDKTTMVRFYCYQNFRVEFVINKDLFIIEKHFLLADNISEYRSGSKANQISYNLSNGLWNIKYFDYEDINKPTSITRDNDKLMLGFRNTVTNIDPRLICINKKTKIITNIIFFRNKKMLIDLHQISLTHPELANSFKIKVTINKAYSIVNELLKQELIFVEMLAI